MKSNSEEIVQSLAVYSSSSFRRIANEVSEKVSQLFHADSMVLDAKEIIVAAARPELVGVPFQLTYCQQTQKAFRIPFYLNGEPGEVVVCELPEGEIISGRLAQVMVELIINETAGRPAAPDLTEIKNQFIYDLLLGRAEDEAVVHQQASQLGLDLRPPRAVILIDAADYIMPSCATRGHQVDVQAQRRAQFIIRTVVNYFHLPSDLICAYVGNGEVVVLKASDAGNLADWTDNPPQDESSSWADLAALKRAVEGLLKHLPSAPGRNFHLSIGRYHPGLRGLARSYQDARAALSLGRMFSQTNQVHCLDELGIPAFVGVAEERTKIDLALHLLSPLDDEDELMETLKIFFATDCCPSQAAAQLSIHRNTLGYRLDKVTSLTGLDPRRFDDAVQIRLALVLRSMWASYRPIDA